MFGEVHRTSCRKIVQVRFWDLQCISECKAGWQTHPWPQAGSRPHPRWNPWICIWEAVCVQVRWQYESRGVQLHRAPFVQHGDGGMRLQGARGMHHCMPLCCMNEALCSGAKPYSDRAPSHCMFLAPQRCMPPSLHCINMATCSHMPHNLCCHMPLALSTGQSSALPRGSALLVAHHATGGTDAICGCVE